jgi:dihydroorotate dehydrogenase (NAD+) catalytic subunit
MNLSVHCGPLALKNPVMTASGTFGYGLEFSPYGDLAKLGAIVVKGLSLKARQGNPPPRIVETSCGFLNAIGLQNIGVRAFIQDKLPRLPWADTPVITNLYAQSSQEFGELAAILADTEGIGGLEVNISCPNVRSGGIQFGQDPNMAAEVCQAVRDRAGSLPVILKLSPNVTDITEIARAAEDHGADVVSLINTLSGMALDIRTRSFRLANRVGGLSGPAIKPVALRMVYETCRAVSIPVIGIGGITSAEDALEFILAGAHAVQVGSGSFARPDAAFWIVDRLEALAKELKIGSWEEFRGKVAV